MFTKPTGKDLHKLLFQCFSGLGLLHRALPLGRSLMLLRRIRGILQTVGPSRRNESCCGVASGSEPRERVPELSLTSINRPVEARSQQVAWTSKETRNGAEKRQA